MDPARRSIDTCSWKGRGQTQWQRGAARSLTIAQTAALQAKLPRQISTDFLWLRAEGKLPP